MDIEQQSTLTDEVIEAVRGIQTLTLNDKRVQELLKDAPCFSGGPTGHIKSPVGGPHLGYYKDVASSLEGVITLVAPKVSVAKLQRCSDGIALEPLAKGVESVDMPLEYLESLTRKTVSCHNDIEPRDILLDQGTGGNGNST